MYERIVIELPVRGKPTVSILGRGDDKIKAMAMHEKIRPIIERIFKRWFEMQAESVLRSVPN